MDLCLALGCSLCELPTRMTSAEFGLWFTRWLTQPWGDRRADIHAGIVASTVSNWSGRTRDKNRLASIEDYMPFVKRSAPEEVDPIELARSQGRL